MDSGAGKDFNLECFLCLSFRAAESGNFEAAVKLSLAYLYNEGCECGSLSWGFGEHGRAQGGFTFLCLGTGHGAARCSVMGQDGAWEFRVRSHPLQTCDQTQLLWEWSKCIKRAPQVTGGASSHRVLARQLVFAE